MTWINAASDRESIIATLPSIATAFESLYASFWEQPHIAAETLELCRLRLAQLHNSDVEWQREVCEIPPEKREGLSSWNTCSEFSDAERACLEFAEMYAMDAQSISDEQAEAVKQHYGDAGFVALVEALGIFYGMTRLSLLWQLPAETGE